MNSKIAAKIEYLEAEEKRLKAEKGAIGSQFKYLSRDTDAFFELKKEMQVNSENLKQTVLKLKELRKQAKIDKKELLEPVKPPFFEKTTEVFTGDIQYETYQPDNVPDAWWTFLERNSASFYHSKLFMSLLEKSFSLTAHTLIAFNKYNEIIGGLPLFVTKSALFGTFATSIPHVNYGGPISPKINVCTGLMEQLPALCSQLNVKNIQVRSLQKLGDWPVSTKKVSMLRALQGDKQSFDASIGAKVRAQAKKAEKSGPSIKFGSTELLNDFYKVFSQNMRDLGTPVYAKTWFENYLEMFPEASEICVGCIKGTPVSCGFLTYHNNVAEIPWASTLRKANRYDMNMWMYYQILIRCIDRKFQWFDFGRSTREAGTFKFKRQWGAREFQHYWYNATRNGFELKEGLNPDNPKFKLPISIWKHLPVDVTNFIGPMVAKDLV
ncbi:FemAB family XrtA/PEP-CTERM system-associated protein [Alteromonas sp. S167]|uniref:FemAB family XrtA/PEP-CTERM system-associated protein n=1 Tax=Alteromonas sp. S167 TaxID=3117402 RepID=UPI002FE02E90